MKWAENLRGRRSFLPLSGHLTFICVRGEFPTTFCLSCQKRVTAHPLTSLEFSKRKQPSRASFPSSVGSLERARRKTRIATPGEARDAPQPTHGLVEFRDVDDGVSCRRRHFTEKTQRDLHVEVLPGDESYTKMKLWTRGTQPYNFGASRRLPSPLSVGHRSDPAPTPHVSRAGSMLTRFCTGISRGIRAFEVPKPIPTDRASKTGLDERVFDSLSRF